MQRIIKNKLVRQRGQAGFKLKSLLLALSLLLGILTWTACQPVISTSSQPTVVVVTSSSTNSSSRPDPTGPDGDQLEQVAVYGEFSSGTALQLPAGQWLDTSAAGQLADLVDLLIESAGPGSPTLAQTQAGQPVLSLENCTKLTFRRIRFTQLEQNDGVAAALLQLINCREIVFENCEFFAGTGAGLLLDNSENIRLLNCLFYDNAGPPIKSGDSWQPSQIRASNCLFESTDSGMLELNLRASRFEECEWIGSSGYLIPVTALDQSLAGQLAGTLAVQLKEFSDSSGDIVLKDNTFSSDEIYQLYSNMAADLPRQIPSGLAAWSISGQKKEEALPGTGLDPALGLRLELQTYTNEAPATLYSSERLAADLAGLAELAATYDPLLSAELELLLTDQLGQDLLEASLPLADLAGLLEDFDLMDLLAAGRLLLLNPALEADEFLVRSGEQITALALEERLIENLCLELDPQLLYPVDSTCYLATTIDYQGTELTEAATIHNFSIKVEQVAASQRNLPEEDTVSFEFSFAIDASSQDCWLLAESGPQPFILPGLDLCPVLEALLAEPLEMAGPDEAGILLQPAGAFSEQNFSLPVFLLVQEENWYTIQTILFDPDCRMHLVQLDLIQEDSGWQLAGGKLVP